MKISIEQLQEEVRLEIIKAGLLPKKTKEDLLAKLEEFSRWQLIRFSKLLGRAQKKQREIMIKVSLKRNPNLLKDMKRVVKSEKQEVNIRKEEVSHNEELTIIDKELNEILNLKS